MKKIYLLVAAFLLLPSFCSAGDKYELGIIIAGFISKPVVAGSGSEPQTSDLVEMESELDKAEADTHKP